MRLPVISIFFFCHNIFKSSLQQRRQKISVCGKGLSYNPWIVYFYRLQSIRWQNSSNLQRIFSLNSEYSEELYIILRRFEQFFSYITAFPVSYQFFWFNYSETSHSNALPLHHYTMDLFENLPLPVWVSNKGFRMWTVNLLYVGKGLKSKDFIFSCLWETHDST